MKIALINASPKRAESASLALLNDLKATLPSGHEIKDFSIHTPHLTEEEIKELYEYSTWVFAFPLYVDGIPSHLLSCLCEIEQFGKKDENIQNHGIVNSGFYEGEQNQNALSILENWCNKMHFSWGMGVGFGGGGGLAYMRGVPAGQGPKAVLATIFSELSVSILEQVSKENIYASIGMPRALYKMGAEMGWSQMMKANGGKKKDLDKKLGVK